MHAVIETSVFLRDAAQAGLSETERDEIVTMVARDPTVGDVIPGTGGARKLRMAGRGKGKSGGYGSSPILRRRMCRCCCLY